MQVKHFFDRDTFTLTYLVWDKNTKDCILIDPVLDFDMASGKVTEKSITEVFAFLDGQSLKPQYVLETHAHADHLSASQIVKRKYPGVKIGIGSQITKVQKTFSKVFNLGPTFKPDGSQFDVLFNDGDVLKVGTIDVLVKHTPGHTPACTTLVIKDCLFVGDLIFMPDSGTGRCDFPDGSAEKLYDSVQSLYKYPDHFQMYMGHDYQPGGRPLLFQVTIGEQKEKNIHIRANTAKEDFIKMRTERDKTLSAPKLLFPSIQVNIQAGALPEPESNSRRYLKLPLS